MRLWPGLNQIRWGRAVVFLQRCAEVLFIGECGCGLEANEYFFWGG